MEIRLVQAEIRCLESVKNRMMSRADLNPSHLDVPLANVDNFTAERESFEGR